MGGGPAMRVAGKNADTGETQYDAASSMVNKPLIEFEDGEMAEEVASSCDVGQYLLRLVFGGTLTLEEANAIFQLSTARDQYQAYLSNESSEGSCESDMGHDKLSLSDSGHLESKTCVTKSSAPYHAIQAFRLLKENPDAQTVCAIIASDPNVYNAVMKNEAFLEYFRSQNTGMNGSLEESIADANYSSDETFDEKERKNGFNSFFVDIKSRVEDMKNSLSSFFQNLSAGPAAADGSVKVEETIGHYIMGLAVMVIMVVVLKRH